MGGLWDSDRKHLRGDARSGKVGSKRLTEWKRYSAVLLLSCGFKQTTLFVF